MADGISDEKFKEEMLRLMKFAVIRIGENTNEIALLRKDFERNTRELKNLKKEIRENSGAFTDIRFRSFEIIFRLWDIQRQVNSIADLYPYLQEEYKRINAEVLELIESIDENPDAEMQLDELSVRLENFEEKAFV